MKHFKIFAVLAFAALCWSCGGSSSDEKTKPLVSFPKGFSWGTASSAYQTEGGTNNDYDRWIAKGGSPAIGKACDSYNRWKEDVDLAKSLGVGVYRMSVEWSRIEPAKGAFDGAQLAHYKEILEYARSVGLQIALTLHHFTNPLWLADEGGFASEGFAKEFADYAAYMAENLGALVDLWNPMNEPMIYISGHNMIAMFDGKLYDKENLYREFARGAFAHAAASKAIKKNDLTDADGDGKAAFILSVTAAIPAYPGYYDDPDYVEAAKRYNYTQNHAFVRAITKGELDFDLDGKLETTFEGIEEKYYPELANSVDIMGVNYYSRQFIMPGSKALGGVPCYDVIQCGDRNELEGDNRNEVYPPGIYESIKQFAEYGLPILITENGMADAKDAIRPSYITMHLMQVAKAISDGYDVRGYWHWSLLDNYEWQQGYEMKFGLFEVDFTTFKRTPRDKSVNLFKQIIKDNGLRKEAVDMYDMPQINPL